MSGCLLKAESCSPGAVFSRWFEVQLQVVGSHVAPQQCSWISRIASVSETTSMSFNGSGKYANLNSPWLTNARGMLDLDNEDLCCKNRLEYLLASACW